MSKNTFALLEGTQSDDVKDILKNANSEKKQDAPAVVEDKKGGQKQGNNNRKPNAPRPGNNRRQFNNNNNTVASPSEESGEYAEGRQPQRGGKRDSGYAPPRRGFAYDRSISRTGRGRGMKKGGAGSHNWGKPEQDNLEAPQEQAENPATPTTPAAEGEQPKEAEQQQQPAAQQYVEEEEKDDSVTYAEYQKKQKEALNKLALESFKKNTRGAGESIAVDPKALAFKNEIKREAAEIKIKSAEQAKPATPATTTDKPAAKKEASKKGEKLDLGALLKDVPTRQAQQSERRGGRGGRGGRGNFGSRGTSFRGRGRGGRGNAGSRVAPPPSLNDTSSFPALK